MSKRPYMTGAKNKAVVEKLTVALADMFVLYFKTHSFHWNVVGPHFKALHEMFEEQYTEIWEATDEVAERIRALDNFAPNNFKQIQEKANLKEAGQTPDANGMVEILANDNRAIVKSFYEAIEAAEEAEDEGTIDVLIARTQIHEQYAWMLESHLKE